VRILIIARSRSEVLTIEMPWFGLLYLSAPCAQIANIKLEIEVLAVAMPCVKCAHLIVLYAHTIDAIFVI
jgi:hypothetical protein